ncbi:hypothetical protein EAG_06459 [Camponotus floridanus]|uniref:Uncharacterized protein n=1 Tax=Camponotus floridanus TaxID=104421 RepID=E1ZYB8_CAMFO|nr:hypothetical protein EAG_06459 [Camponotus floridanus]
MTGSRGTFEHVAPADTVIHLVNSRGSNESRPFPEIEPCKALYRQVSQPVFTGGYRDTLTVYNLNAQSEYYTMQPAPGPSSVQAGRCTEFLLHTRTVAVSGRRFENEKQQMASTLLSADAAATRLHLAMAPLSMARARGVYLLGALEKLRGKAKEGKSGGARQLALPQHLAASDTIMNEARYYIPTNLAVSLKLRRSLQTGGSGRAGSETRSETV